jgi:hypothetical protein
MAEDVITTLGVVIDGLSTAGGAYALCGGLAVNLHGPVRATKDIDVLIPREELDRVRTAVQPLGFNIDAGRSHLAPVRRRNVFSTEFRGSSTASSRRSI